MSTTTLTLMPEEILVPAKTRGSKAQSDWVSRVAAFVNRAAEAGESVTLTSRQRMLTPAQMADRLGVSRSTISRRIKSGEIKAVKVGNRNRIPYLEFERFWNETMGDIIESTWPDLDGELFGE